jgi:hypothetical protein
MCRAVLQGCQQADHRGAVMVFLEVEPVSDRMTEGEFLRLPEDERK